VSNNGKISRVNHAILFLMSPLPPTKFHNVSKTAPFAADAPDCTGHIAPSTPICFYVKNPKVVFHAVHAVLHMVQLDVAK
jgi:hypothetical protein